MNKKEHKLLISSALGLLPTYSQANREVIHSRADVIMGEWPRKRQIEFQRLMLRMWESATLGRLWAEGARPIHPWPAFSGSRLERWLARQAFMVGWHGYHNDKAKETPGALFADVLDGVLLRSEDSP